MVDCCSSLLRSAVVCRVCSSAPPSSCFVQTAETAAGLNNFSITPLHFIIFIFFIIFRPGGWRPNCGGSQSPGERCTSSLAEADSLYRDF